MEEKLKQKPSDLIKVVLFGPESTGKSTLAKQLAEHYNTKWIPEFSRAYLQKKWNKEQKICEKKDIIPIAEGQISLENEVSLKANKVLFCDTNLLQTKVYSEAYFNGFVEPKVEKYALENKYDLYLLAYIDVPWEDDDLRDRPDRRGEMFNLFKTTLETYNLPFMVLKGTEEERLKMAITEIDKL